jgi:hypothetical protein
VEANAEPEPELQTEPETASELDARLEPDLEPESVPELEPVLEPEPEPEPVPRHEPQSQVKFNDHDIKVGDDDGNVKQMAAEMLSTVMADISMSSDSDVSTDVSDLGQSSNYDEAEVDALLQPLKMKR